MGLPERCPAIWKGAASQYAKHEVPEAANAHHAAAAEEGDDSEDSCQDEDAPENGVDAAVEDAGEARAPR